MTTYPFNFSRVHPSWKECLHRGLSHVDPTYLNKLAQSTDWLPGPDNIFNAFSQPLDHVHYVLFGESPYPRRESANGYAFWDAAVKELWSPTGLSKKVNRATSLRNIFKMLLIAEGLLNPSHSGQEEIAKINKSSLVKTNDDFFHHLLKKGFLLLNATLVLQPHGSPQQDARAWYPFTREILFCLLNKQSQMKFILLGRIAHTIDQLINHQPHLEKLHAEHPYNCSFITNFKVIDFFRPLHLLRQP
ncbi:MAG: uracil-DNA glycosylase [Gammaproteobacteria bacterium]|nr:MAG: uracil-DNA glycosylase [Gammaproteobacteria bacterium]